MEEKRRVRIGLAYDGTDYHGWQLQPRDRTIQGELEAALSRMFGGGRHPVRGAGRTDAGVHAQGQVADVSVPHSIPDEHLLRALRSMLPEDIRVRCVRTAATDFHAWRHAVSKTYAYRLDRSEHGSPFLCRFALHWPSPLDAEALQRALGLLQGRRDWSGFADSRCDKEDRVRNVLEASYHESGSLGRFVFRADGFLTRMVRNLVGTLLEIGRGAMGPDRIEEILRTGDRTLAGPTAPARGLHLERVEYPGDGGDEATAKVARHEEGSWAAFW